MHKQKGFTLVEVLLVVLVVSFIGFAGYYVWDNQTSKEKSSANSYSSKKATKKKNKSTDITAKWETYETPDKLFSVKIPDGLHVQKTYDGSQLTITPLTYVKDAPVTYEDIPYSKNTARALSIYFYNGETAWLEGIDETADKAGILKKSTLKTRDGLDITKYHFTQKDPVFVGLGEYGVNDGFFGYSIKKGNQSVTIQYNFDSGDEVDIDLIEKVVTSTEIK